MRWPWQRHKHIWSRWTQFEKPESNKSMLGTYETTRTLNQRECSGCGLVQQQPAEKKP